MRNLIKLMDINHREPKETINDSVCTFLSLDTNEVDISDTLRGIIIIKNEKLLTLSNINLEIIQNCNIVGDNVENSNNIKILKHYDISPKNKTLNCGIHKFPFKISLKNVNLRFPTFNIDINVDGNLFNISCSYTVKSCFIYNHSYNNMGKHDDENFCKNSVLKEEKEKELNITQNLDFKKEKIVSTSIPQCFGFLGRELLDIVLKTDKSIYRNKIHIFFNLNSSISVERGKFFLVRYVNIDSENFGYKRSRKVLDLFEYKKLGNQEGCVLNGKLEIPITEHSHVVTDIITIVYFIESDLVIKKRKIYFQMPVSLYPPMKIETREGRVGKTIGVDIVHPTFFY